MMLSLDLANTYEIVIFPAGLFQRGNCQLQGISSQFSSNDPRQFGSRSVVERSAIKRIRSREAMRNQKWIANSASSSRWRLVAERTATFCRMVGEHHDR
ncbi:MAG: hypothetical protein JWN70_53 [Planctomycetaceae bacterium]|nr:hypothetical protein [Planctomycetaceae bacterium]